MFLFLADLFQLTLDIFEEQFYFICVFGYLGMRMFSGRAERRQLQDWRPVVEVCALLADVGIEGMEREQEEVPLLLFSQILSSSNRS